MKEMEREWKGEKWSEDGERERENDISISGARVWNKWPASPFPLLQLTNFLSSSLDPIASYIMSLIPDSLDCSFPSVLSLSVLTSKHRNFFLCLPSHDKFSQFPPSQQLPLPSSRWPEKHLSRHFSFLPIILLSCDSWRSHFLPLSSALPSQFPLSTSLHHPPPPFPRSHLFLLQPSHPPQLPVHHAMNCNSSLDLIAVDGEWAKEQQVTLQNVWERVTERWI